LPVVQTGTETAEIQAADRLRRALGATETWLAAERHQLVLFVPVLLGAGIAAWFLSSGPLQWGAVIAIALAVATAGMALGGLVRKCLVFGGLLVAAGLGLAWLRAEVVEAPVLSHRTALTVTGTVLSVEDLAARGRTRILIGESPELPGMKLRISVRGKVADGIEPGAQVRVRAALSPPPGPSVPGGYHFARRAWFDGIGAVGYAIAETELIAPPPARLSILAAFERFRERLTRRLQTAIGGPEGGLAAALVHTVIVADLDQATNAMIHINHDRIYTI
jgi:competence protein ComEC